MFPKKGNYFPSGTGTGKNSVSYQAAIAAALRAELGNSHQAVKTVMRWTGANERTVKNWFAGRRGPRGEHLLALIRHSNSALEIVLRLAGREQIIAAKVLLDARNVLAEMLALIDRSVNGGAQPVNGDKSL
jgi:pyocin large subunit-like protein